MHFHPMGQCFLPSAIEVIERLARKCLVLAAVGELAAAAQHQCLMEGTADGQATGEFARSPLTAMRDA